MKFISASAIVKALFFAKVTVAKDQINSGTQIRGAVTVELDVSLPGSVAQSDSAIEEVRRLFRSTFLIASLSRSLLSCFCLRLMTRASLFMGLVSRLPPEPGPAPP